MKNRYTHFCNHENSIPLFSQAWWLDATAGENNWDVVLVEKGGEIYGSLPFCIRKKACLKLSSMPKVTQTIGPFIKYPRGQKYYKKLSWEKSILTKLIEQLPKVSYFNQNFHHSITNWLPFFWQGFSQSTRYSYQIKNISLDDLEKEFETDIRRRRTKAQKAGIAIVESTDIVKFYELNSKTFLRQNKKIPYSLSFVKKLYDTCCAHNSCKLYFARNIDGEIIAANFLVFDDNVVYYLMGGIEPRHKDIGGMDLVLYESIKFAISSDRVFDFEGSMIESIEKYFRSFGAIQVPYHNITKTNSNILKIYQFFKELVTS
jgi:lipid II:glycine glycyltransferase (peptidoglycan interpeptide bridge formation enzyme)